jgi:hypothetical protein
MNKRSLSLLSVAILGLFVTLAQAQNCTVVDPELQGAYEGGCSNGLAEGHGLVRSSIAEYRGEFKAGQKHGQGHKHWFATDDRYQGGFVNDAKQGQGQYTWGMLGAWAGESYTGEYMNDQRHGHGRYVWPFGDVFVGEWHTDRPVSVATPMMVQRATKIRQHTSTLKTALNVALNQKTTVTMCKNPLGLADPKQYIQATLLNIEGDLVYVQPRLPIDPRTHQPPPPRWDFSLHWFPCQL